MNPSIVLKISALDSSKAVLNGVKANLEDVEKSVTTMRSRLESLQPTFQKMAFAGTVALGAIGAGANKAIKNASDLGESINAVNVVFGEGAKDILEFGLSSATAVGMSTAAFNQMATITGALLKDTGKPLSEVADMTSELAIRAADMASVFNTDVNDAMSAINQAIRGETEAIRRYAGDVTDASLQTYLFSQGIQTNVTDLTEQEKRLYRVQLIMAQTAVTAGDFANTSDSLANRQRILAADMENLSATIGAQLIPVLQSVLNAVGPVLTQIGAWVERNPELTRNIIIVAGALAGLTAAIGIISLALLAFNPVVLIIIGVIAGIGLVIYSVRNAIEMFGGVWSAVWDGIKSVTGTVVDWIVGKVQTIIEWVEKALDALASLPGVKTAISITKSAFRSVSDMFRADGGPVSGGTPYIVGERGPELFVPNSSGSIIPNGALQPAMSGQTDGSTFVFNVQGDITERVKESIMRDLKRQMRI